MAIKLVLEIIDSNGVVTKKIYLKGGLRKIVNEYPEYEYHAYSTHFHCGNYDNNIHSH